MDIIEEAKKLSMLVKECDEYLRFKTAKEKCNNDLKLKKLNVIFEEKRERLNISMAKDEPDKEEIKILSGELREVYNEIRSVPSLIELESSECDLNLLLGKINTIVSEGIYDGNGNVTGIGCAGNCAFCGGCC
ncbi:MAG: YlbF family regulator [Oscillospiraceae bacterium]|jgi:cell fate (sporulation/competence/biofilm development) regulator YlbF (YheA/YmcA/DUF963 family)|nr:YlbF family regulator [Oscillospiraceae bacterium]